MGAWNQDEAPVTGGGLLGLFAMFALGVLAVVGGVLHLTGGVR